MTSPENFAGIADKYAQKQNASIFLQSIPYDGTSSWGKGADKGFEAFMDAAANMELYDIETNSEVYKKGIHIIDPILENESPEAVYQAVLANTKTLINKHDKFFTFFGGEHSISIGLIEAFRTKYPGLSVLQLDAHSDLRENYEGSPYNHACALHRASKTTNLVQVGIRSMDSSELKHLNRSKCYFAEEMFGHVDWMQQSIDQLNDPVYLTIDLDVFDPSILPSTGTPEPGGLLWNDTLKYLKLLFEQKNVVAFDIVELAPEKGQKASDFLAAKLYYKLLSYKFELNEK